MKLFRVLAIAMVFSLLPNSSYITMKTANSIIAYAKEKKKPKGAKAEGGAKVFKDGEFVSTDESIAPEINKPIFGAVIENNDMPENCIKAGKMITKDGNYFYELADGSYAQTTWVNVDIDNDGLYEYLYFGPGGVMKVSGVTPNGSKVNEYGALLDENGNVKKLLGVVAEANNSGINSVSITQINNQQKNEQSNEALNKYLTDTLTKSEMPSKSHIRNILKTSGMNDSQIELYISNLGWIEFGKNYIKAKTDFETNKQYVKKELLESILKSSGLTDEEVEKAFLYSSYSNWERYTIDFVNNILDNSAGAKDDKMIQVLVSHGLTKEEAKAALSKIYGRTVEG